MPKKLIAIILCSFGAGMLVVTVIPRWWGLFSAFVIFAAGIFLLVSKC